MAKVSMALRYARESDRYGFLVKSIKARTYPRQVLAPLGPSDSECILALMEAGRNTVSVTCPDCGETFTHTFDPHG